MTYVSDTLQILKSSQLSVNDSEHNYRIMKITTVSISYSRKFNLGNFESIDLGCSLWAQVDEEEEADRVAEFLYLQAKASVKNAAIPVLKASEYQINKVNSQRKCSDKFVENDWEDF